MFFSRGVMFVFAAATAGLVGGCQNVGPISIDQGRDRYNNIIASTSKEQTFSNIIRVHNHEPTSFLDVTEVDATTSFTGTLNGTASGIGAKPSASSGTLGSITSGVTYSESPLIRYTPLLGQALVAQLVTPVSPDVLEDLFNSGWDVTPTLDMASATLTPDFHEFYLALNILSELYSYRLVSIVANKSDLAKPQSQSKSDQGASTGNRGANDSLTIYLNPHHLHGSQSDISLSARIAQLWMRFLSLYVGTQHKFTPQDPSRCAAAGLSSLSENELKAWDNRLRAKRARVNLNELLKCVPNSIELRIMPVPSAIVRDQQLISGGPILKTSSALGVLKTATERPGPKIAFVSPDQYRTITGHSWNKDNENLSFYTLLPQDEDPLDNPTPHTTEYLQMIKNVSQWIASGTSSLLVYEPRSGAFTDNTSILGNRILGSLRRYILIIVDDKPPSGPTYVVHLDHGTWYYIDGRDEISQKNFNLISLFLTMMAVPSALPPIAPTISVGGSGG